VCFTAAPQRLNPLFLVAPAIFVAGSFRAAGSQRRSLIDCLPLDVAQALVLAVSGLIPTRLVGGDTMLARKSACATGLALDRF
jgi:hypothetical protein